MLHVDNGEREEGRNLDWGTLWSCHPKCNITRCGLRFCETEMHIGLVYAAVIP